MRSSVEVVEFLRSRAVDLRSWDGYSEADTCRYLVDPVLDFLGYPVTQRRYEAGSNLRGGGGNRPDVVVWEPGRARRGNLATAIVEVKALGVDLGGRGRSRLKSPKEQIARYTLGCDFSGVGTLGMLTDGNVWHLVRSGEGRNRAAMEVGEFRLLDGAVGDAAAGLEEIQQLVRVAAGAPSRPVVEGAQSARELIGAVAEGRPPQELLGLLAAPKRTGDDLKAEVSLDGELEYAELSHWASYAFGPAGRLEVAEGDLESDPACAAVVQMSPPEPEAQDGGGGGVMLRRDDVAAAAAAFAKSVSSGVSVVLVVQPDESGAPAGARLSVRHRGHTGMTAEFDPRAPSPLVLRSVQRIQQHLRSADPVPADGLADAVSPAGAQKAFYGSVSGWVLRRYAEASGGPDPRAAKEAVLRHLIRTLFVWILKEEGRLPPELFDRSFADRCAPGSYHRDVLAFMFHERLNKPAGQRGAHNVAEIDDAMREVAFLNGSLFAVHDGDEGLSIPNEEYFGPLEDGKGNPLEDETGNELHGLFEILSDYDWTASEHLPDHSDQTIDPEVLGSLFENLIAVTEAEETPKSMPRGTYYTPPDVAREMVKDALALAVRGHAPPGWTERDLLDLFGDHDIPAPAGASEQEQSGLAGRIEALTVFDPCVGSGAFLVAALHAMRSALAKLGRGGDQPGEPTRRIVSRQLYAQDINPMAAQITRLRLFIALIAAEPGGPAGPLPNLEAKIVCADTLCTAPRRDWAPSATGTLQDHQSGIIDAVRARGKIFAEWQDAHDEPRKAALRADDDTARRRLQDAIRELGATPETEAFAGHRLLDPGAGPALTDARLLFYNPDRAGFDIVIGNPPYESLKLKQTPGMRERLDRLGYKTTKCYDLYALIAEAGLTLANPDHGVLTLIVPLSVCFGQNKARLRELLEASSSEIRVRSQDNRPDTTFKKSPVAHPENRQRTSILSAVTSTAGTEPEILVTGASKWPKAQRHSYLAHRKYTPKPRFKKPLDKRLDHQWERMPTPEISELIATMRSAKVKIRNLQHLAQGTERIGFPKTAYEYVTTTPAGELKRDESTIQVGDKDNLAVAIAAVNSHLAYTWWKTYGDTFHINPYEIETVAIPDPWLHHTATQQRVIALSTQLIKAISEEDIPKRKSGIHGTEHQTIDFHKRARDVIAEIDNLYIAGFGLKPEPLLTQLRTLRTNTTWRP